MSPALWIAALVGLAASTEDVARRRVSNWIPISAFVGGLTWQFATAGWAGAGRGLLGTVCGFGVFLIFYLLGGMGGGDVKLMAGYGALLGPGRLLEAALCTALIGGVMAVGALLIRKCRIWLKAPKGGDPERMNSIPYAPAISLGALVALLPNV